MEITCEIVRFHVGAVTIKLFGVQDRNLAVVGDVQMDVPRNVIPPGLVQGDKFRLVLQGRMVQE